MQTIIPDHDFDLYNSRQLWTLQRELTQAQNRQDAAAAVSASLAQRYAAFQKSAAAAQANATTAASNLAATQTTTQTLAQGLPLATDAQAQATLISAAINPVLVKAHETALLAIDALTAIEALGAQVSRRKGNSSSSLLL